MLGRMVGLTLAVSVGAIFFYLSRFWTFQLWPKEGFLGIANLRPKGGLLRHWLRGSDFVPFELLLWACAVFLLLSFLQRVHKLFASRNDH
jgi:hypothetical protein